MATIQEQLDKVFGSTKKELDTSILEKGLTFTGNEFCFQGRIEILDWNVDENKLQVKLTKENKNSISDWNEEWNLKHFLNGYSIGEYRLKKDFPGFPPTYFSEH